jgi:hypothetical protein
MNRQKVIGVLRFFRDIEKMIRLNERVIKNLEDQYYNSVGAVNIDGMPHGKGNPSSPVERAVLHIPKSVRNTISSMERDNSALEKIKAEILRELNRLNYHQKEVVLGFYIDGLQWERISERINYSPRQCRYIRENALEKLAKGFAANKLISRYRFPEK